MKNNLCDSKMSFEDCELAILRDAVDRIEEEANIKIVKSPEVTKIFSIVEQFLRNKKLICYGGTAINSILPEKDQFYNKNTDIPDYDFFSPNSLNDAIELTNIYFKKGFKEVESKAGVHKGTYKVFVNFLPVADITQIDKNIFNAIKKDTIVVNGISYAPPNFLRMSMFLELSRPQGDVSRWEKVLKRLILLNKNYPLIGKDCHKLNFQRELVYKVDSDNKNVFNTVKETLINQGVVFFGSYALSLYSQYMPKHFIRKFKYYPDFDVLSETPEIVGNIIKERLNQQGINNVRIVKKDAIGETIAEHYEVLIGKDTIVFIYKPLACHSYNIFKIGNEEIKIATIDTILSFYLAFLYSGRNYYDTTRILCIAQYLFILQQHNRLKQTGLLKRFTDSCYGHQETIEEIRTNKSKKYMELKYKKDDPEYQEYFFKYIPNEKYIETIKKGKSKKEKSKKEKSNKIRKTIKKRK
jgi:Poly(A) polymerase catalytic subunit